METIQKEESLLWQLRKLMPHRAVTRQEAYRLAELQANRLLQAYGVDQPGTPDELITDQPFVTVSLRADLPVSGLTNWRKPRWQVILNQSEPAVRRRFSLHHEFKHILDHGLAEQLYPAMGFDSEERIERVCDYFAACVLMPKRILKRRFFEGLWDPSELAAEFGVSPQAMRYRLEQLSLVARRSRCAHPSQSPPGVHGYLRRASVLEAA